MLIEGSRIRYIVQCVPVPVHVTSITIGGTCVYYQDIDALITRHPPIPPGRIPPEKTPLRTLIPLGRCTPRRIRRRRTWTSR